MAGTLGAANRRQIGRRARRRSVGSTESPTVALSESVSVVESDPDHAVEVRRAAFARAGFDESDAEALARRPDIAYLDARALLQHGFPPALAAAMLVDGQRAVF
jgi:hypothetical protein